MPLSKHFGGHGAKVMKSMKSSYRGEKSPEEIERIFYATENAKKHVSRMKDRAKKKNGG